MEWDSKDPRTALGSGLLVLSEEPVDAPRIRADRSESVRCCDVSPFANRSERCCRGRLSLDSTRVDDLPDISLSPPHSEEPLTSGTSLPDWRRNASRNESRRPLDCVSGDVLLVVSDGCGVFSTEGRLALYDGLLGIGGSSRRDLRRTKPLGGGGGGGGVDDDTDDNGKEAVLPSSISMLFDEWEDFDCPDRVVPLVLMLSSLLFRWSQLMDVGRVVVRGDLNEAARRGGFGEDINMSEDDELVLVLVLCGVGFGDKLLKLV